MTMLEAAKLINTEVTRPIQGLRVSLKILDVKVTYGQIRYLVTVVGQNTNAIWINA